MAMHPNEYTLITLDPGAAATGWSYFTVNARAFSRPEHRILSHIEYWDCGEFRGSEHDQLSQVVQLLLSSHHDGMPYTSHIQVISEGFELTQRFGGDNLLSPVRINAVIAWECANRGLPFDIQKRSLRVSVTRDRLSRYGFGTGFKKDEFAAMQHAIVWLRRIKQKSKSNPWKLSDGIASNALWDCACESGEPCDMHHR